MRFRSNRGYLEFIVSSLPAPRPQSRNFPKSWYPPNQFALPSAVSLDHLNPLPPPVRSLEWAREVLCLMDDLAVAELHNAHCV